jgi:hypothetical protein
LEEENKVGDESMNADLTMQFVMSFSGMARDARDVWLMIDAQRGRTIGVIGAKIRERNRVQV